MNATMNVAAPRVGKLADADDPYKKYWLLILVGLGLTGAWLCLPLMETSVGSARVDTSKPSFDPNAVQSLDSVDNPSGAPGQNLTVDGKTVKNKSDEPVTSMLYQSAPETPGAAASGAPVAAVAGASAATLAQQLKDVGDKKNASGWAEGAARGFGSPRLSGSLSGIGSAKGGSSASAGVGVFGSKVADVTFESGSGLQNVHVDKIVGASAALRKAAEQSQSAVMNRSNDAAASAGSRIFDGTKNSAISAAGAPSLGGGQYQALDTAPVNLKLNDPKMDSKELKEPPASATPESSSTGMSSQQMGMMAVGLVIAGVTGGTAAMGAMMTQMIMAQAMAQSQASENRAKANSQAKIDAQKANLGGR